MANPAFTVQFYKYPDRLHWRHDMVRLGEDEHGVWIGMRSGGTVQRGAEPPIDHPHAFVSVISEDSWFIPIFSPADPRFAVYVDISTPVTWSSDHRVEAFDLDLDVTVGPDGRVSVLDEDEFDDHRGRFGYPQELVTGARAATDQVLEWIDSGRGPFGGAADRWFRLL